jgi:KDO2-lipid IV(A) lauroyltransferase
MNKLAIASSLNLSLKEKKRVAKDSFQNLVITSLEFFRLQYSRFNIEEIATCTNIDVIKKAMKDNDGKGVILVSGHQANWEVPFLCFTSHFNGIAVGRPIKNPLLYEWVLSVRQLFGGKIIPPKKALSTGIKAINSGSFVGLVADQALPESSYSYPFLGTRSWVSSAPALLAYKTGSPIIVIDNYRKECCYTITCSEPLWPNQSTSLKSEVLRLMDETNKRLEKSVRDHPGQYLWQHNKWKQEGVNHQKKKFRFDFILVILKSKKELSELTILKQIYPRGFLHVMLPSSDCDSVDGFEVISYENKEDILLFDWKYQFIIDFTDSPKVKKHFLSLGAFKVLSSKQLYKIASMHPDDSDKQPLSDTLFHALCKPDTKKFES